MRRAGSARDAARCSRRRRRPYLVARVGGGAPPRAERGRDERRKRAPQRGRAEQRAEDLRGAGPHHARRGARTEGRREWVHSGRYVLLFTSTEAAAPSRHGTNTTARSKQRCRGARSRPAAHSRTHRARGLAHAAVVVGRELGGEEVGPVAAQPAERREPLLPLGDDRVARRRAAAAARATVAGRGRQRRRRRVPRDAVAQRVEGLRVEEGGERW